MVKEGEFVLLRMPSGEIRRIRSECTATLGQVGNVEHQNINLGKAGRKRHMGWRPSVRGTAMTPRDHPHGAAKAVPPSACPVPRPLGQTRPGIQDPQAQVFGPDDRETPEVVR
jgi:large subunit ribosomal protein L2